MLRSLLLMTAGAAGGWYAHRALGPLVEPAEAPRAPGAPGPSASARFAQRAGIDPETLARQAGQAAGDAAAAAVNEGVARFTERLKTEAPPWVSALATRATVIAGEAVDAPTTPTTSTRKDTTA